MKEQIEDFRETFVKSKEPRSSHTILEGTHHDAPNKIVKSLFLSKLKIYSKIEHQSSETNVTENFG